MSIHNVVINDDTTGTIDTDTLDGQSPEDFMEEYVTVKSHDENGNHVEYYGRLTEILD